MTTAHPERNWTQLQEGLNRVRKELGVNPHTSRDPEDKSARVMSAGKHKHIYSSRKTPPQLPRLSTPPEYYSDDDLRRGRRKVVPPVKPKRDAFQRPLSEEDSYDSGESSDEGGTYPYHNGPAPPQPYPYGYYQPPMVYPTMPAFYPQPQPHHQRTKRRDKGKGKGKNRYRPQERRDTKVKHLGSRPSKKVPEPHTSHRDAMTHTVEERGTQADESDTVQDARALSKFKAKESLNFTPVVNDLRDRRTDYPKVGGGRMDQLDIGYLRPKQAVYDTANLYAYQRRSPQPDTSLYPYASALDNYKYIHPNQHKPSYSPVMKRLPPDRGQAATAIQKTFRGYSTRKGMSAAFHFHSDRRFAQNYVDSLLHEMMEEELVPDILIEVLSEHGNEAAQQVPTRYSLPPGVSAAQEDMAVGVADDFLHSQLKTQLRELALEANKELVDRYFLDKVSNPGPILDVSRQIMEEAVQEGVEEAVKRAIADMVGDTIFRGAAYDWMMDLTMDVIGEFMPDIVREAVFDLILEQMINTEIVSEVVEEEARDTATQVLDKYDNAVLRRELREVASRANKRLLDGVVLHHLMNLFARDGQVLTREDLALRALDGVMLDTLLKEYFQVRKSRQFTLENWSSKRLHEKVVTDTAVDVVLTELGQQLDEDMEDLHEYEWQLEDPDSFRAGGLDLKEWLGKLNISPR